MINNNNNNNDDKNNNKMFRFFTEYELIAYNQSGFKPGDSYINQLLCITH